jgi:hypothetical protein
VPLRVEVCVTHLDWMVEAEVVHGGYYTAEDSQLHLNFTQIGSGFD